MAYLDLDHLKPVAILDCEQSLVYELRSTGTGDQTSSHLRGS